MYALHARSILASINRDLSRNGWWRLRPDLVQKTKVDLVRFDDPRRDVLFPPVPRNFARRDLGSWLSSNRLMTRLHVFVVSPLFFFNVKEICSVEKEKKKYCVQLLGREELSEFHRFDWLSMRYTRRTREKNEFYRLEKRLFVYSPLKRKINSV